jgi:hypothetical protein
MNIQHTANGKILITDVGQIAGECCCGDDPDCDSPIVNMTVTGITSLNRSGFDADGNFYNFIGYKFYENIAVPICLDGKYGCANVLLTYTYGGEPVTYKIVVDRKLEEFHVGVNYYEKFWIIQGGEIRKRYIYYQGNLFSTFVYNYKQARVHLFLRYTTGFDLWMLGFPTAFLSKKNLADLWTASTAPLWVMEGPIQDYMFGHCTFTNGLTFTWSRNTSKPWNTCNL